MRFALAASTAQPQQLPRELTRSHLLSVAYVPMGNVSLGKKASRRSRHPRYLLPLSKRCRERKALSKDKLNWLEIRKS